jgi:hypothetical protein
MPKSSCSRTIKVDWKWPLRLVAVEAALARPGSTEAVSARGPTDERTPVRFRGGGTVPARMTFTTHDQGRLDASPRESLIEWAVVRFQ